MVLNPNILLRTLKLTPFTVTVGDGVNFRQVIYEGDDLYFGYYFGMFLSWFGQIRKDLQKYRLWLVVDLPWWKARQTTINLCY